MQNPTLELIHRHGSVRNYKTDPVPEETIRTIIAAAQRGSTSSNLQMYSVVAVYDANKRAQVQALCNNQRFISQAPVFLAWCADLSRLERICALQGIQNQAEYTENFILSVVDATIASQTAAIAAESLGLGICFVGAIRNNTQAMIDLLHLPPLVFPLVGMTVGWPVEAPLIRPRLPLDAVLHKEQYDASSEQPLIDAYDQAMIATGIYKNRQVASETEGILPEKQYGWAEHSARRAALTLRPHLRSVLEKAGFLMK